MSVGQLHYHLYGGGDTNADTDARPIVLLHELGGSIASWQWALPHLTGTGVRSRAVVAIDLPGHGQSPRPEPGARLGDYAGQVADVLAQLGLTSFDIVGVALGGIVAPFLDQHVPDQGRRAVLSATPVSLSPEVATYCRERADKVRVMGMEAVADDSLRNSFPSHLHGSDRQSSYRALFVANDPDGYAIASYALADLDNAAQLGNFEAMRGRVRLVCGAQDPLFPVNVVAELAEFLEIGDGATVLPEAGHFPHVQDSVSFAAAAVEFFDLPGRHRA